VFPDGEAGAQNEFEAEVEYGKVGAAFGAGWEKLGDPDNVPSAIARCIKEVRGGRSAVLRARVTRCSLRT